MTRWLDMELWDMEEDLTFLYDQSVTPNGRIIWKDLYPEQLKSSKDLVEATNWLFPSSSPKIPVEPYLMALGKLLRVARTPSLETSVRYFGGVLRCTHGIIKFKWNSSLKTWFLRIGRSRNVFDYNYYLGSIWVTIPYLRSPS